MQYAIFKGFGEGKERIIEAGELCSFQQYFECQDDLEIRTKALANGAAEADMSDLPAIAHGIVDVQTPESEFTLKLIYGCYKAQPGMSALQATLDASAHLGAQFGTIRRHQCFPLEICDLVQLDPIQRGHVIQIPVAALVASKVDVPKGSFAMTAFIRYANISALDNIFNRPGLFALYAQEKRKSKNLTRENWRSSINHERLFQVGSKSECDRNCGCGSIH